MNKDSTDKIRGYLEAVKVGGKPLRLSPLLLRGYTCPANCGGCCPVFSLDYLPSEDKPEGVIPRDVDGILIYSDLQKGNKGNHCKNLDHSNGRCKIHGRQPFSCDFELVRFSLFSSDDHANHVAVRLFGRGWNMLRVDGERGALCEITEITPETIADVARKFRRLEEWAIDFHVPTRICAILDWIENSDHKVTYV